jgi:uncharacterized damage-inducible protein DinB
MAENLPEVWLRGPLDHVPSLLQPVAHTLLQAVEEIKQLMYDFPRELIWERPSGVASPGFHLLHIVGVLDRLTTYADGMPLNGEQLRYLKEETNLHTVSSDQLVAQVEQQVQRTIAQLKNIDEASLTEVRTVGRKVLPSTVQGLLFHAAEHTMRHTGQLLVTVKVLKAGSSSA